MSRSITLADNSYQGPSAKTSHGLVRGPRRFPLAAVVDATAAGQDAGEALEGRRRDIPIVASVAEALALPGDELIDTAIVGVATPGGVLPDPLRASLIAAAEAGLRLINGLHRPLDADPALAAVLERHGTEVLEFRRPRPILDLHHWTGRILDLETPRVAVLGTDCCIGKRTTANLLLAGLRERGRTAELIYTGQTGWLQGHRHGFFFDATPNDFVSGELERVLLECAEQSKPDVMLLEGQSAFFNPSGPCGPEFLLSGGAKHVVLQTAPGRVAYDDLEHTAARIPPVTRDVALARAYGADVLGITLNGEGLNAQALEREAARLSAETGLPVSRPLVDGGAPIVERLLPLLSTEGRS